MEEVERSSEPESRGWGEGKPQQNQSSSSETAPGFAQPPASMQSLFHPIQRAAHAAPAALQHMRIDHGGFHIRVPEQLLCRTWTYQYRERMDAQER
jgi:hypothetical protein